MSNDRFEVRGKFIKMSDSGKAFLVILTDDKGKTHSKWVPLSQAKSVTGVGIPATDRGEILTFTIPNWLADKEGFKEILHESALDQEYGHDDEPIVDDAPPWGD